MKDDDEVRSHQNHRECCRYNPENRSRREKQKSRRLRKNKEFLMVAPVSDVGTSDEDMGEDFIVTGPDDDQHLVSCLYSLYQQNKTIHDNTTITILMVCYFHVHRSLAHSSFLLIPLSFFVCMSKSYKYINRWKMYNDQLNYRVVFLESFEVNLLCSFPFCLCFHFHFPEDDLIVFVLRNPIPFA